MADLPRHPDTGVKAGVEPHHGSTSGRPRWGSVLGIVLGVGLVVLFVGAAPHRHRRPRWPLGGVTRAGSSDDRGNRPHQALRRNLGRRRPFVHRAAGPGDRVSRPQRGREVDDDADDPWPRCADSGFGDRQRPALRRSTAVHSTRLEHCSMPGPCTGAAVPTTTFSASRSATGSAEHGWTTCSLRSGCIPSPASAREASRSAWHNAWASPPHCSAIRGC
jgi:hypothetical protein